MSVTAQTIIQQAYGYSLRNRSGSVADEATELVNVINRLVLDAFLVAASLNPAKIGVADEVDFAVAPVNGWPRPARALSIYRIEAVGGSTAPALADGTEVVVVPDEDRRANLLVPTIYERGDTFFPNPAGHSTSPTGGKLRILAARRPNLLTAGGSLTATIDPLFPDDMAGLLVVQLALYLAGKDGRTDELDKLVREEARWATLWEQYLSAATVVTQRRWAPRSTYTPRTQVEE